jgi:hypothetical protein
VTERLKGLDVVPEFALVKGFADQIALRRILA